MIMLWYLFKKNVFIFRDVKEIFRMKLWDIWDLLQNNPVGDGEEIREPHVDNSWSQMIHDVILLLYMFDSYQKTSFKKKLEAGGRQMWSAMTERRKEN